MNDHLETDICVIGAGSGGLSVAAGAVQMGASVVLIEKDRMGGDCLNYGCVPSKSLLAAGHAADSVRGAKRFGIDIGEPAMNGPGVYDHVRRVIAAIEPNDSVERFEALGVRVLKGAARFDGPRSVVVDGVRVAARRFVIATGSAPAIPPIPGLDSVPYLTNETVFDRTALPGHLLVVGGGPIGIELAQAHRQLGCPVTVLEMDTLLANDDPELVDVVRDRLRREGVDLREGVRVVGVRTHGEGVVVTLVEGERETTLEGSHLLVATGRRPNVGELDLEQAGIARDPGGIRTDRGLRTTNRRVYAIGDAAGGPQFTHVAAYHAGIVLRSALFRLPARADHGAVPRVTYTDPELAQVGKTEAEARDAGLDFRGLRWPFAENDRAQAERMTDGLAKVIVSPRGGVIGAGIVGARAGELIQTWCLALAKGLKVGAIAGLVVPYPTLGEVNKRAAGSFYTPTLFGPRTRWLVRLLRRLG